MGNGWHPPHPRTARSGRVARSLPNSMPAVEGALRPPAHRTKTPHHNTRMRLYHYVTQNHHTRRLTPYSFVSCFVRILKYQITLIHTPSWDQANAVPAGCPKAFMFLSYLFGVLFFLRHTQHRTQQLQKIMQKETLR